MAGARWCSAEGHGRPIGGSDVDPEIFVVALLDHGVLGPLVGLHPHHEIFERRPDSPPFAVARGRPGRSEAPHEGVEIGQELRVLGEHLGGCGAEPGHPGHRLLEESTLLFLLEVVGKMLAQGGDRPYDLRHPIASGGLLGGKRRAEAGELLEQFPVLGEEVPQERRVGPVDGCHGGGLRSGVVPRLPRNPMGRGRLMAVASVGRWHSQSHPSPDTFVVCSMADHVPSTVADLPAAPAAVVRPFRAQAVLSGTAIDLARLGAAERPGGAPLVVELVGTLAGLGMAGGGANGLDARIGGAAAASTGVAVLFRYGAAVFFGVSPEGIAEYLRQIGPHIRQPLAAADRETEGLEIRVEPGARESVEGNVLVITEVTLEKLQVIADIMAKSVSLAHHERNIERQFERIEPFAVNLEHWGRGGQAARELLQHLGTALLAEHRVVAGARVDDSPELLWDHPELERLWARLRDEFEIRERFAALHGKLALISRTAETALELLQNRRALRVEYAIVGLIVFEILLTLLQWWISGHAG